MSHKIDRKNYSSMFGPTVVTPIYGLKLKKISQFTVTNSNLEAANPFVTVWDKSLV